MIQRRGGLCLALKAGECLRVTGNFLRQELEGNEAMQARVFSFVHHTHPATADLLDDAIVRDGLADHAQECYGRSLSKSTKAMELAVFQQGQISKVPAFLDRARWR